MWEGHRRGAGGDLGVWVPPVKEGARGVGGAAGLLRHAAARLCARGSLLPEIGCPGSLQMAPTTSRRRCMAAKVRLGWGAQATPRPLRLVAALQGAPPWALGAARPRAPPAHPRRFRNAGATDPSLHSSLAAKLIVQSSLAATEELQRQGLNIGGAVSVAFQGIAVVRGAGGPAATRRPQYAATCCWPRGPLVPAVARRSLQWATGKEATACLPGQDMRFPLTVWSLLAFPSRPD